MKNIDRDGEADLPDAGNIRQASTGRENIFIFQEKGCDIISRTHVTYVHLSPMKGIVAFKVEFVAYSIFVHLRYPRVRVPMICRAIVERRYESLYRVPHHREIFALPIDAL